jgi:hypothetical protein
VLPKTGNSSLNRYLPNHSSPLFLTQFLPSIKNGDIPIFIDIETENRHYYGVINSGECSYRINGCAGCFIGKSKQIVREQGEISYIKSKESAEKSAEKRKKESAGIIE